MKRYKLLKELPTFKAGDEFFISESGNLIAGTPEKPKKVIVGTGASIFPIEVDLIAYTKETLQQFPNILTDWFEESTPTWIEHWYITGTGSICKESRHILAMDTSIEDARKEIGNYFQTKEEAEKHLEWMKARAIIIQDTKGFKPDRDDERQLKCSVVYDHVDQSFYFLSMFRRNAGNIYFETKEDAENSIKTHEKEWRIYLQCQD